MLVFFWLSVCSFFLPFILKSTALRVGVMTLDNTMQCFSGKPGHGSRSLPTRAWNHPGHLNGQLLELTPEDRLLQNSSSVSAGQGRVAATITSLCSMEQICLFWRSWFVLGRRQRQGCWCVQSVQWKLRGPIPWMLLPVFVLTSRTCNFLLYRTWSRKFCFFQDSSVYLLCFQLLLHHDRLPQRRNARHVVVVLVCRLFTSHGSNIPAFQTGSPSSSFSSYVVHLRPRFRFSPNLSIQGSTGVGASKFWGVQKDFCPNFQNLRKKRLGHFLCEYFLMKTTFRSDLQKQVFARFWARFWGRFWLVLLGTCTDFQGFCEGFHIFFPDFHGFCPDFQGFCPNFYQIKTFWGMLAPPASPPPTSLQGRWTGSSTL